jgi:cytidylate kinase
MNKNEKFVITINRELGSGGRTVGRKLAEKLGVHFYDKAVIKGLQEKYGLSVREIERAKGNDHGWWSQFKRLIDFGGYESTAAYYNPAQGYHEMLDPKVVFKDESEILQAIADDESCIIAGRSAFYIFREHPNHISILIQASMPYRVRRVMAKQNMTEKQAIETIETIDKMRENYVKTCTKTSRYDTRNYQLVIAMDNLTEDDAVAMILDYIDRTNR